MVVVMFIQLTCTHKSDNFYPQNATHFERWWWLDKSDPHEHTHTVGPEFNNGEDRLLTKQSTIVTSFTQDLWKLCSVQ
jgi:hypothetical protein